MYFPKSQIKSNQYSNGELYVKTTKKPYIGYYWSISNGQCFVGKSPDSVESNIELIKPENRTALAPSLEPAFNEEGPRIIWGDNTIEYLKLNKDINSSNLPKTPKYNSLKPTKEDYDNQEITRYFCKKINESLFIEISKSTYNKLLNEDSSLDYQTYFPFALPWTISGKQDQVAIINKNAIDYAEVNQQAQGLAKYLKYNYLLYYNLTPGITLKNLSRVYSDTGEKVPDTLPQGYKLGSQNKICNNCSYNMGGNCTKWMANIKNNYFCSIYKPNPFISEEEKTKNFLKSNSSLQSLNIYNRSNNTENSY